MLSEKTNLGARALWPLGMLVVLPVFLANAGCGDSGTPPSDTANWPDATSDDGHTVVCEPESVGCEGLTLSFACDDTGTFKTYFECGLNAICAEGLCQTQICEPSTARCTLGGAVTCADDGLSESFAPCSESAACAESATGCACVDGVCEARQCFPGDSRCVDGGMQRCRRDGRGWGQVYACWEDTVCLESVGGCVEPSCTPGSATCLSDVLAVCDSDGSTQVTTDCRDAGERCSSRGSTTACVERSCVPDSLSCSADNKSVEICDVSGGGRTSVPCPSGEGCVDGWCVGLPGACPKAQIIVAEGDQVPPSTTLHLSGVRSVATAGDLTRWHWRVTKFGEPDRGVLAESSDRELSFQLPDLGAYLFTLDVWDSAGQKSCTTAIYTVAVVPDSGLRVEVAWETPNDVREQAPGHNPYVVTQGADVDVHLLHPRAQGIFNFSVDDASGLGGQLDWGAAGPLNDPVVARVDDDGGGPEIIVIETPEDGATYVVGAHYWNAHDHGATYPTVRIYIDGELAFEDGGVE